MIDLFKSKTVVQVLFAQNWRTYSTTEQQIEQQFYKHSKISVYTIILPGLFNNKNIEWHLQSLFNVYNHKLLPKNL